MSKSIKVSIVIPTYNRSSYLLNAIESSLKQSYNNIQTIIHDNTSTNDTEYVLHKFKCNTKVKFFKNISNIRMNKNFKRMVYIYSTDEWVIILSSDIINSAVKIITANNNLSLVWGDQIVVDSNKNKISETKYKSKKILQGNYCLKYYLKIKKTHMNLKVTSIFNRKKAINSNSFSGSGIFLDASTWTKLLLERDVIFIDENITAYMLQNKNSLNITLSFEVGKANFDEFNEVRRIA